jgi:hypothetical protein
MKTKIIFFAGVLFTLVSCSRLFRGTTPPDEPDLFEFSEHNAKNIMLADAATDDILNIIITYGGNRILGLNTVDMPLPPSVDTVSLQVGDTILIDWNFHQNTVLPNGNSYSGEIGFEIVHYAATGTDSIYFGASDNFKVNGNDLHAAFALKSKGMTNGGNPFMTVRGAVKYKDLSKIMETENMTIIFSGGYNTPDPSDNRWARRGEGVFKVDDYKVVEFEINGDLEYTFGHPLPVKGEHHLVFNHQPFNLDYGNGTPDNSAHIYGNGVASYDVEVTYP